jgi:hypothetical protein
MMQLFTEEGWSIVTNKKRVGLLVLVGGDLRQYIYEQKGRIRTNALAMDGLYGNNNGHVQDIGKNNGHNGKVYPDEKIWRERPAGRF